jgi:hypothetical protein
MLSFVHPDRSFMEPDFRGFGILSKMGKYGGGFHLVRGIVKKGCRSRTMEHNILGRGACALKLGTWWQKARSLCRVYSGHHFNIWKSWRSSGSWAWNSLEISSLFHHRHGQFLVMISVFQLISRNSFVKRATVSRTLFVFCFPCLLNTFFFSFQPCVIDWILTNLGHIISQDAEDIWAYEGQSDKMLEKFS